ncbi:MAG: glycosyltransferase family A protein [Rhodospirillaceae bacterium]|nr:glycosyltransferase family A protein [Rhodospirillaceae bacterium]
MTDSAPDFSVIVPSRLQERPGHNGALWLERALETIAHQTRLKKSSIEVLVALDAGVAPPTLPPSAIDDHVRFVNAPSDRKAGQASAVNAAMAAATGETIAMLEDDDAWKPTFLETAVEVLAGCDFVSSSQMLVDQNGLPLEVMYFPTPSGWVMRRSLWDEIGGFNGNLQFHVDVEWIGRLNESRKRRVHLVEAGFPLDRPFLEEHRRWLAHLAKGQKDPVRLFQHRLPVPLVIRTQNEDGGTGRIRHKKEAGERSKKEMAALRRRFGDTPW